MKEFFVKWLKYKKRGREDLHCYLLNSKRRSSKKKKIKIQTIYAHPLIKNGPKKLADFFVNNLSRFEQSFSLLNIGIGLNIPPDWLTFFRDILQYTNIASLEIWQPYIRQWKYGSEFPVWHGDVRNIAKLIPSKSVDTVLWAQGPEHVPINEFLPIYSSIKKVARQHILFVTPWGGAYDCQEDINNNPFEVHQVKGPDERIYKGTNLSKITWAKRGTPQAGMLAFEFLDDRKIKLNWHEDFIVHLAKIIRPRIYVELGLYQCELFNRIVPFADKLIGVDIVREAGKFMEKSKKTEFVCMSTDNYAKKLKKKPIKIDMLFIDANHSKESVLKDFQNYFPFVKEQGIILLHDGYPKNKAQTHPGYCGDGYKAIEKLSKNTKDYEMMTIPVPPGLTLCRKRKKHLKWNR